MASWPRGRKSGGGGGWLEKSLESRPVVVTVADNKIPRRERGGGEKKEIGSGMTNTALKAIDV